MVSTDAILSRIKEATSPETFQQISAHLAATSIPGASNVNQNSLSAAMMRVKPSLLKEITTGPVLRDETMDNQNHNQARLEDLMTMKPQALRELRTSLRGTGRMSNCNENIGQNVWSDRSAAKPRLG